MMAPLLRLIVRFETPMRMFVGAFFLVAATLKVTQTTTTQHGFEVGVAAFASAIERGGVVPSQFALLVAIGVLSIEVIVGIGLLSHRKIKQWSAFTIVFLFLLTSYLILLQIRGKTQACGCLGQWDSSIPLSIARNALLSLACLPALLKPQVPESPVICISD